MMNTKRQALLEIIALWRALASQDTDNLSHEEILFLKQDVANKIVDLALKSLENLDDKDT